MENFQTKSVSEAYGDNESKIEKLEKENQNLKAKLENQ